MHTLHILLTQNLRRFFGLTLSFVIGAALGILGISKSHALQALVSGPGNTLATADARSQEQCIPDAKERGAPLFISCAGFLE